jgi:hypothetical protein
MFRGKRKSVIHPAKKTEANKVEDFVLFGMTQHSHKSVAVEIAALRGDRHSDN